MKSVRVLHRAFLVFAILLIGILSGATTCLSDEPLRAASKSEGTRVLVAYHSLTGNTKAMAEGVVEGVQAHEVLKVQPLDGLAGELIRDEVGLESGELDQLDAARAFQFDRFKVGGIDHHIPIGLYLVALHDFASLDFSVNRADQFLAEPLVAGLGDILAYNGYAAAQRKSET